MSEQKSASTTILFPNGSGIAQQVIETGKAYVLADGKMVETVTAQPELKPGVNYALVNGTLTEVKPKALIAFEALPEHIKNGEFVACYARKNKTVLNIRSNGTLFDIQLPVVFDNFTPETFGKTARDDTKAVCDMIEAETDKVHIGASYNTYKKDGVKYCFANRAADNDSLIAELYSRGWSALGRTMYKGAIPEEDKKNQSESVSLEEFLRKLCSA